ncbi:uncharacterized protein LOC116302079 [Actinia tenebrosa]|uniref:Uncharacterized protein LOC116302079 n=1 Tax=Actinia tenebrosa TaxID=6105 RepID=A0A6P8IK97_ACTTE|nr:uncharacterized protein LOC116302079 [Actinia tenebrosa]
MSHSSNLFVFSFTLLDMEGHNILSSADNHTVAMIMGSEDHGNMKESLANVNEDVNSLIDIGKIQVQDKEFKLEFFLGGDYKFLLNAMRMKAATSDISCIWCNLHKQDRCCKKE